MLEKPNRFLTVSLLALVRAILIHHQVQHLLHNLADSICTPSIIDLSSQGEVSFVTIETFIQCFVFPFPSFVSEYLLPYHEA